MAQIANLCQMSRVPVSVNCAAVRFLFITTTAENHLGNAKFKRAIVALARGISVILNRMWVDDTDFRSDIAVAHAA